MSLIVDACVAQHQGDRKEQQDRVALFVHPKNKGMLLGVVADGMGGHTGGALAAEQVVHTAQNSFNEFASSTETPRHMLETSFLEAHMLIKASRFINEKDPHSTAVMFVLEANKISWAYCGDSRFYWFRDKTLHHMTKDHSFVEQLVSRGRLTPEQAMVHPTRNILTTSLGGEDEPIIDFEDSEEICSGDTFLLCSDGLSSYFDSAEIGGIVSSYTARNASDLLIKRARTRARGVGDNISLVILKLQEDIQVSSPFNRII